MVRRADGTALFTLGHRFTTVNEANLLLAGLSGPTGPFAGLKLDRSRAPWATTLRLQGPGDFGAGLASFGDAALATTTGGGPFGIVDAEVLRQAGATKLDDVFTLQVDGKMIGRSASWTLTPGRTTPIRLTAQRLSWATIASAAVALLALVVFLVLRRSGDPVEAAVVEPAASGDSP
jgi:hypothetical protein